MQITDYSFGFLYSEHEKTLTQDLERRRIALERRGTVPPALARARAVIAGWFDRPRREVDRSHLDAGHLDASHEGARHAAA